MTGQELREARRRKGWTQQEVAARLGVTQAYFSMLENGRRMLPYGLGRKVAEMLDAPATTLPLREEHAGERTDEEKLRAELAALSYPGFAHLRGRTRWNPAEVLMRALNEANLDTRVVEGLPWLALTYADMDWDWVVRHAKLLDRQNRLGFVTTMAYQLATNAADEGRMRKLKEYAEVLDRSRLVKEDTLCHDSLTNAEKEWLRANRPSEAVHWNLLTDMKAENLPYASK